MRAYTAGQMTNIWTPRRVSNQDLNDDGQARRADRRRIRANLRVPVRYDPDRSLPDAADYESSDMEEDYMQLYDTVTESRKRKGSVGPEAAEAFRARRTRMSKKSDAIRLILGRNLIGDAVYFNKIESLNADSDYRAALDHIETQEKRVSDARLQEHGTVTKKEFWAVVMTYMEKSYTMGYVEALAKNAKEGLAQARGEDVDAYVVRARVLRKTVAAFMTAEERTPREVSAFKVDFAESWITGLLNKGNLQIAYRAAVRRGIPMGFKEVRTEALAIEQCTGQQTQTKVKKEDDSDHGHVRRAPANAAGMWGQAGQDHTQGAPTNAAGIWGQAGQDHTQRAPTNAARVWGHDGQDHTRGAPANAAGTWGEEEQGYGQELARGLASWAEAEETGAEPAAMAAVAKLAEQIGRLQESLDKGSPQGQTGKGGYQGQAGKGGYQGQTGKGGYQGQAGKGGYQGQAGKGGYKGQAGKGGYQGQAGKGGKGTKGGYTPQSSPNGGGPHPAQGGGPATQGTQMWGPATPNAQTWQTTVGVGWPPPPMPPAMPSAPPENCRTCTRRGEDGSHEYKFCQYYVGCGVCKRPGHYGKECTLPCPGCGQTGMLNGRRHVSGCHLVPVTPWTATYPQ